MKKLKWLVFAACVFTLVLSGCAGAQSATDDIYPQPGGFVNDYTGLLTESEIVALNDELISLEQRTSVEVAVVIIDRQMLQGSDPVSYAEGIGMVWGVGKAGIDNGVVFLIVLKEAVTIQPANGVTDIMNNEVCQSIIDSIVVPNSQAGDLPKGVIDGTRAIIAQFNGYSSPANSGEEAFMNQPVATAVPVDTGNVEVGTEDYNMVAQGAKILFFVMGLGIFLFAASVTYTNVITIRTTVREQCAKIAEKFEEADKIKDKEGARSKTRKELEALRKKFLFAERKVKSDKNVNWIQMRSKLEVLDTDVSYVLGTIEKQVEEAREAKVEGKKLLKKLPGHIRRARKALKKGERSPLAEVYLRAAQRNYERAHQHTVVYRNNINWILLYMWLNRCDEQIYNARETHMDVNVAASENSYNYSSMGSSRPSISPGFGNIGGFSGGGGFNNPTGGIGKIG